MVAVGAVWRRPALVVLLVLAFVALVVALAGAWPLRAGALVALVLAAGALLAGAMALAGADALGGRGRRPAGKPGSSRRACGPGRAGAVAPPEALAFAGR